MQALRTRASGRGNRALRRYALTMCAVPAFGLLLMQSPVRAQDADAFFSGRQIRIIVGSPAGRGYDAYARLLARHLGRHLPVTFVVENMPGASGLRALNHLYAV